MNIRSNIFIPPLVSFLLASYPASANLATDHITREQRIYKGAKIFEKALEPFQIDARPSTIVEPRYHAPSFRPTHQINPRVAVFCAFFKTPSVSVRKNG